MTCLSSHSQYVAEKGVTQAAPHKTFILLHNSDILARVPW